MGIPRALLTTSCIHALELEALMLNIQPGDEEIVPSFTFVSTVNAFVLWGAKPVFADILPDTLNLKEEVLGDLTTERTKAILPVHYTGVGCEMDPILQKTAHSLNLVIIEENAHGPFGKNRARGLGTFGVMAPQSFHEPKNISCGEGGELLAFIPYFSGWFAVFVMVVAPFMLLAVIGLVLASRKYQIELQSTPAVALG